MNKAELKEAIETSEMPSSESAKLVDHLDEPCPHFCEGTCQRPELSFYEDLETLEI